MTAPDKDTSYTGITGRIRKALLFSDLPLPDKVIGLFLVEHTNGDWYRESGHLVAWIGVPATSELLGMHPRTVKRGRATLYAAGIMSACYEGGNGAGDTTRVAFSVAWLEAMEETLRRGGRLARSRKGVMGDRAVTLPGLFDREPAVPGMGDSPVTHDDACPVEDAGKGDRGVTLNSPKSGPEAVDESRPEPAPVGNSGRETAQDAIRVAETADKGDRPVPIRVTPLSPEPLYKPGSNLARRLARGPRRSNKPTDGQGSIMLPIPGGRTGKPPAKTLDGVVAANRALIVAGNDARLEELLHRAGALLGGRAEGNIAVAALQSEQPDLYRGLLRGQEVTDDSLRTALGRALDAARAGVGVSATTPAAPPPEAHPARMVGLSEGVIAATVTRVLSEMAPTIIAATLQALGLQGGTAMAS